MSFYTLKLPQDKPVLEYRKMLLLQLHQIYQHGNLQTEIEHILYGYGSPHYGIDTDLDVIKAEVEEILNFFALLQPENLYHCVIAKHIEHVAKRIDYCTPDILVPFLNSEKYKIYSALAPNRSEDYSEGYEQMVQRHKDRVRKLAENYTSRCWLFDAGMLRKHANF